MLQYIQLNNLETLAALSLCGVCESKHLVCTKRIKREGRSCSIEENKIMIMMIKANQSWWYEIQLDYGNVEVVGNDATRTT